VDRDGLLNLADLENAITDETAVVSLMWANNETGVLFPVNEIAELCRSRGVLFHCDAVQAVGQVAMDGGLLAGDPHHLDPRRQRGLRDSSFGPLEVGYREGTLLPVASPAHHAQGSGVQLSCEKLASYENELPW